MLINNLIIQFFTHDFSLTETASASISSPHHCTLKNFSFIYTSTLSYWVITTLWMQGINNIQNNAIAFSTTSSTYSKSLRAFSPKSWPKKKASLELQDSLPHPQETINGRYPHPLEFSLHTQTLPYAIIFWCSATCYRQISYSPCMTHIPHIVLFDLISLETMRKQYKFSCSHFAVFVQPTATFCLLHAIDSNVPCCSNILCLSHIMKEPLTPPLILSTIKQEYEN